MALTFYYGSGSPYTWRVWLALEYKRIAYELKVLSFSAGDQRQPEYTAINPRGKVPAIVDGDFTLYESSAIIEYLDEQYPSAPLLFPGTVQQRALARRLICEADLYCAAPLRQLGGIIFFTPQDKWSAAEIAEARDALCKELARWETQIAGDYLVGPLSAADFTLYPQLALVPRMDKKKPDLDIRGAIGPRLAAWMARIEALPYFAKTLPPHWK